MITLEIPEGQSVAMRSEYVNGVPLLIFATNKIAVPLCGWKAIRDYRAIANQDWHAQIDENIQYLIDTAEQQLVSRKLRTELPPDKRLTVAQAKDLIKTEGNSLDDLEDEFYEWNAYGELPMAQRWPYIMRRMPFDELMCRVKCRDLVIEDLRRELAASVEVIGEGK